MDEDRNGVGGTEQCPSSMRTLVMDTSEYHPARATPTRPHLNLLIPSSKPWRATSVSNDVSTPGSMWNTPAYDTWGAVAETTDGSECRCTRRREGVMRVRRAKASIRTRRGCMYREPKSPSHIAPAVDKERGSTMRKCDGWRRREIGRALRTES
jgi:hypothetical protein